MDAKASPGKLFNTGDETQLAQGSQRLGGKLIDVPVLGEILSHNNLKYAVISTGTPGGTRILHHKAECLGGFRFSLHRPDATQPSDALDKIIETCGSIPSHEVPSLSWLHYATDVYLDYLEPNLNPDVMVLWYCEPDNSYHQIGLGSPENLNALRAVDREFGRIIDREAKKPIADRLHIITLSDHGMVSLLGQKLNLAEKFRESGFTVGETTEYGSDVALALSSAGGVYVRDSDPALIKRVVQWLQTQNWCGPLFTVEGQNTLRYDLVHSMHRRAADISLILKADNSSNQYGITGGTLHDCSYPEGGGMHGGLHENEVRSWLAISGRTFRDRYVSPVTAGIIDILPTILYCLGIETPEHVQGRLLSEGIQEFANQKLPDMSEEIHVADGENGYRALIALDRVDHHCYLRRAWTESAGHFNAPE